MCEEMQDASVIAADESSLLLVDGGCGYATQTLILTLDSLSSCTASSRAKKRTVVANLSEFIACEFRNRHQRAVDVTRIASIDLRVPQQTNSTDCGCFLLHNAEMFVGKCDTFYEQLISAARPARIFDEWYAAENAASKRHEIRGLFELLSQKYAAECGSQATSNCLYSENDDDDDLLEISSGEFYAK